MLLSGFATSIEGGFLQETDRPAMLYEAKSWAMRKKNLSESTCHCMHMHMRRGTRGIFFLK